MKKWGVHFSKGTLGIHDFQGDCIKKGCVAYVLIPAAQWEELEMLVKHSVMLGESPLGSIAKNSREYPNSIEAVMKLVLQIGGAEDGNESKK